MYIEIGQPDWTWQDTYKLTTTFIQPRPIGLVSTLSQDGIPNLAPFSFYNMVSANPPVVFFAPSYRRDKTGKDSLHNAEATGEFVVATVTEDIIERVNQCSFEYAAEVDEFVRSGLTPAPARLVRPSLVAESPANIECKLLEIRQFGAEPGAGSVVFGQVVAIHVNDDVLADDRLADDAKLRAVGRMGRSTYARTSDRFDLGRPKKG